MRHTFTPAQLQDFARRWPCSGMGDPDAALTFEFATNGDLIDITGESPAYDGAAIRALSHDAQRVLGFDLPHLRGPV